MGLFDLTSRAARRRIAEVETRVGSGPQLSERVRAIQDRVAREGVASVDVTPRRLPPGTDCERGSVDVCGVPILLVMGGDYFVCVVTRSGEVAHVNMPALLELAGLVDRLPGKQSGVPTVNV